MGDKTGISWTDATWNPTVGCSVLSAGCQRCYAMKQAARVEAMGGAGGARYAGLTVPTKNGPVWNGVVRLAEDALTLPLRWTKPRMIFVNSMSDLFHESLPDEAIDRVFAVMALAPQHTFQVLTKRAERMRRYFERPNLCGAIFAAMSAEALRIDFPEGKLRQRDERFAKYWPALPNVWLGTSVEDQENADERLPELIETPAAVRFISAEPLLGHIELTTKWLLGLDWVIVGGESGPGARPMHPDWARALRDQCTTAGVFYFFKQWGEWSPGAGMTHEQIARSAGVLMKRHGRAVPIDDARGMEIVGSTVLRRIGKRAAGDMLDGRQWHEFPKGVA